MQRIASKVWKKCYLIGLHYGINHLPCLGQISSFVVIVVGSVFMYPVRRTANDFSNNIQ